VNATLTINRDGQIDLPEAVRRLFGAEAGSTIKAEVSAGRIEIVKSGAAGKRGVENETKADLVDWLLSCPEKGWLNEARHVETTSDIKPLAYE
jgi:bifunctional DNA-binding transcriptional regulator/antitoxin component of YhaV-PrlF toxin-antitoxin module